MIWFEDDDFQYVSLSPETIEAARTIMNRVFLIDENVAVALELPDNPKAIEELGGLFDYAVEDNASIVTIEKSSGKVVACSINKIECETDEAFFGPYLEKCKTEPAIAFMSFMVDLETSWDPFEAESVDCTLEIMFLSVLREFRGRGIARKLHECTIELARSLKTKSIYPKAVTAIYTSTATQHIGQSLGFKRVLTVPFDRWSFKGKTFLDRTEGETVSVTFETFKL